MATSIINSNTKTPFWPCPVDRLSKTRDECFSCIHNFSEDKDFVRCFPGKDNPEKLNKTKSGLVKVIDIFKGKKEREKKEITYIENQEEVIFKEGKTI